MKNKQYWKDRAERTILESERSVLEYEKKLRQAYDISLIEIRKEIDAFFNKYATDNKVPYAEARRRLSPPDTRSFQQQLEEWYRLSNELGLSTEYKSYLKLLSSRVYISRLEHLQANIRFEIEKLASDKVEGVTELLMLNYIAAYYGTAFNTSVGVNVGMNFAAIDNTAIQRAVNTRWLSRNYKDSIWNDRDALVKALTTLIPQSFSRGLSSNDIGEQIAKQLNVSLNRGRTLARTEVNFIANQAALDSYKIGNLEWYEYLATLDMRTSDICRDLDGKKFKVSEASVGINLPPMHPNCRSTTIPYFEDDDTEDRIARDEDGNNIKVSRRTTQEQWIKEYVPEDQQAKLLTFLKKYRKK